MPRGNPTFNAEAVRPEIFPVTLLRILNIPERINPDVTHSLYLCDSNSDLIWFDENRAQQVYTACGFKYSSVAVSQDTPISQGTLTLGNVDRRFSSLAQYAVLRGAEVHLFRGFVNKLDSEDGAQLLFLGHLDAAKFTDDGETSNIEVTIRADFSLQMQVPRRTYWVNDFPYIPAAKDVRKVYVG